MSNVFLGSLMCVPFNFAPKGYAFCAGQILSISQNTALFSLLGTTYGGDGKSNFALPDLQGRMAISAGQGPGLSLYDLGQTSGEESLTLLSSEIPVHTHVASVSGLNATVSQASGNALAKAQIYGPAGSSLNSSLNQQALQVAGGSQPHNNMMPYLTMNWIIALQGVYPPRS